MVTEHGYLVERYLPDATIEQVADATSRARELARGAGIRYLWSAFVPEEGSCFCLFTVPSAEKVLERLTRGIAGPSILSRERLRTFLTAR